MLILLFLIHLAFSQPPQDESDSEDSDTTSSSPHDYPTISTQSVRPKTTTKHYTHRRPHYTTPQQQSPQTQHLSKWQKRRQKKGVTRQSLFPEGDPSAPFAPLTKQEPTPIDFPTESGLLPSTIYKLQNYELCRFYKRTNRKLELMVFTQFWPGQKCIEDKCSLPMKTTKIEEGFMLHGLWPQLEINRNYVCCLVDINDIMVEQKMKENTELLTLIRNKWMSLQRCRFAIYQFDKHGTCSMTHYTGEDGPLDYMRVAIYLKDQIDIWQILKDSRLRVETEKLYDKNELKNIIKETYGAEPAFYCVDTNKVLELRVCYDISEDKFHPKPRSCQRTIYKRDEETCERMVMFREFPKYLLDPITAPRNNCEY
ncbi:ribonuclease 3 precursor, putative [Entamoeba invadens IP1]|uniref:Ribonuclease 3, putative n=1 Tax=Entamoeba invadens IP1 TaxID=370355 RepID=A0A0A1UGC3_ENTIV|nr:ribonuclease 3 precursor, putative [Entamoeba invadens IP1]ELP92525.1 ribonuclease 3 precursor, putative [Entamoeba invadens IP1]|eukprot:XP_004259296.1 ribonuclease 3 precursor, putative [Entamoeba invadens IP1]